MAPTSIESSEKERRLNEEVPLQKVTFPRLHLDRRTRTAARVAGGRSRAARGPSWGHLKVVLGAIRPFLVPFCGHISPKIDKVSYKMTFEYPHEGPCVEARGVRDRHGISTGVPRL